MATGGVEDAAAGAMTGGRAKEGMETCLLDAAAVLGRVVEAGQVLSSNGGAIACSWGCAACSTKGGTRCFWGGGPCSSLLF